jgi:hypothetical protein
MTPSFALTDTAEQGLKGGIRAWQLLPCHLLELAVSVMSKDARSENYFRPARYILLSALPEMIHRLWQAFGERSFVKKRY